MRQPTTVARRYLHRAIEQPLLPPRLAALTLNQLVRGSNMRGEFDSLQLPPFDPTRVHPWTPQRSTPEKQKTPISGGLSSS